MLERRPERLACPNCDHEEVAQLAVNEQRWHNCRGLAGLSTPLVPAGMNCKVEAHERDDYVGGDRVQTDGEGRPIMNVTTTRDDGQDVVVYAPTASGTGESIGLVG
jgi:hypothetical protein